MDPIVVPEVPKSAFNKDRPVSDLIRCQVEHFRHVEDKLSAEVRAGLPNRNPKTEGDAALYIAAMTRLLQARATPAARGALVAMPSRRTPARLPETGLAIAAAAETGPAGATKKPAAGAKKKRSGPKKKSGSKK